MSTAPAGPAGVLAQRERDLLQRVPASLVVPAAGVVGAVAVGVAAATVGPTGAVAALVAVVAGVQVVRRPVLGALLLAGLVPVLPGLRRGLPLPGLRLSEVLIVAVAAAVLLLGDRRAAVRWRALDWAAFAYVAGTIVLTAVNLLRRGEPIDADVVTALGPLQYFLLYRVVVTYLWSPARQRTAVLLALGASVPIAALGIAQAFDVPGVLDFIAATIDRGEVFEGWEYSRQARITSVFPHWHPLAGYLVVVLLLGVSLLLTPGQRVLRPRWLLPVLAPAAVALAFTATIASMFGAVVGALVVGAIHRRLLVSLRWLATGLVLVGLVAGPFLVERYSNQVDDPSGAPESVTFRLAVWGEEYLPALEGRLTTGYGPDLPPEIFWDHTENQYLTLLLRGGVPLLAAFLALLATMAARARAVHRADGPDRRAVAGAVLATLVVLLPMQMVFPYLTSTGMTHLLWVLVGLVAATPPPAAHRHGGTPAAVDGSAPGGLAH